MTRHFMDLAFTDSVRKIQQHYGTRDSYQRMESKVGFRNQLTWKEKRFIQHRDFFFMATVGENGWPYMQFRGGPEGFLQVLDEQTLAFLDFRGNGQYITTGNLKTNSKTLLFFMDYARQQRLKIWGETEILKAEEHRALSGKLTTSGYPAIPERIYQIRVLAFDWNCPQHITPRFSQKEIEAGLNVQPAG